MLGSVVDAVFQETSEEAACVPREIQSLAGMLWPWPLSLLLLQKALQVAVAALLWDLTLCGSLLGLCPDHCWHLATLSAS